MKKFFLVFISFYFLALIESSFLGSMGMNLHLIWIAVFLLNIFESPNDLSGIFAAFSGGLFLDIFSEKFIGFHILIFLTVAILLKLFLRKYVRVFREKS